MALSNIFREPRRELIEQAFGLIGLLGIIVIWLLLTAVMCRLVDGTIHVPIREFCAAAGLAIPIMLLIVLAAIAVHAMGEAICGAMAQRGHDPRPKNRY